MPTDDEMGDRAKRLLRSEMALRGVSYKQLADKLTMLGMPDTAVNLRNTVSRGKFTAAFLLAALEAMGTTSLRLVDA